MTKEKLTGFWEHTYENGQYLEHWDYKNPSQELVTFTATGLIPEDARCLDLGCGAGNEAIFLAQCGYRVAGIDLSKKALVIAGERARNKNVEIEWIQGDVLATGLESDSFDFINDRGCFHHIKDIDRPAFSKEMARLLRVGGHLMIRGCSDENSGEHFVLVNKESIDRFFKKQTFDRGPVLPIIMISDAGTLESNIVILTKK